MFKYSLLERYLDSFKKLTKIKKIEFLFIRIYFYLMKISFWFDRNQVSQ